MTSKNQNSIKGKGTNKGSGANDKGAQLPDLSKLDPSTMTAKQLAQLTSQLAELQNAAEDAKREAKGKFVGEVRKALAAITPPEECTVKVAFRTNDDGEIEREVTVSYGKPRKRSGGSGRASYDGKRFQVDAIDGNGKVTSTLGTYTSPSTAAKEVTGTASRNGRQFWKLGESVDVGEVYQREYKGARYALTVLAPEGEDAAQSGDGDKGGGDTAPESSDAQSGAQSAEAAE